MAPPILGFGCSLKSGLSRMTKRFHSHLNVQYNNGLISDAVP